MTNQEAMGCVCNLCILIRIKSDYDVMEVAKQIAEIPETCSVNYITGDYDLSIMAKCRSREEMGFTSRS